MQLRDLYSTIRVAVAPLQSGAGVKGKVRATLEIHDSLVSCF